MHSHCQFKILSDICAVDYPWKINRFQIYYNFLSLTYNSRLTIIIFMEAQEALNSIVQLFSAAGWFERELWDLFGIFFLKNLDLRKILSDYGFKGHPLRKDFPLTGFCELKYSEHGATMVFDVVSLAQISKPIGQFVNVNSNGNGIY